jgi:predicted short-subunit dehydrogenase-like oxidoreductase (DUF2520 family)
MNEFDLQKLNYLIIGAGKVGFSIAELLKSMGINFRIYTHSFFINSNTNIPEIISPDDFIEELSIRKYIPDFIIISVPDKNINSVSVELAKKFSEKLKNIPIFHTSGIHCSELIIECKNCGAITASVHPYQTFYKPSKDLLSGIGWGIESKFDLNIFIEFVKMLKGNYHILKTKEEKIKYHLSAVKASNFLNALLSSTISSLKDIDLSFDDFAMPIIRQTIINTIDSYHNNTNSMPLTGPIARGDLESIKLHLSTLKNNPDLLIQYIYHSLATLEIAKNQNIISENVYNEIKTELIPFAIKSLNSDANN